MSDIEQLNQSLTEEEVMQPTKKSVKSIEEPIMLSQFDENNEPVEDSEEPVEDSEEQTEPSEDQEQTDEEQEQVKAKPVESNDDEIIEDEEPVRKPTKPKGKYSSMTLKELKELMKERSVPSRSFYKTRDAIIARLEQLDAEPQTEQQPTKPKNKYQSMTIPELKKLMGERNIAGRSTIKTKDAIIEKLMAYDENPEEVSVPPKQTAAKGRLGKAEAYIQNKESAEEEDPQDEEVNKRVAELVNKLYKIKKHAKKQSPEFKTGFMDYIKDLSTLVDDYHESNQ